MIKYYVVFPDGSRRESKIPLDITDKVFYFDANEDEVVAEVSDFKYNVDSSYVEYETVNVTP